MTAAIACPVCRADHIGSLLRPKSLRDGHKALAQGKIDEARFAAIQADAIRESVAMQEAAGMGAVTDGEFRRRSWFAGFVDGVDGLVHKDTYFKFVGGDAATVSVPVPFAEAPIRRIAGITTHEFDFVKDVATKPVKITMPAPSVIHFHRGPDCADTAVYPDPDKYWADLVAVYRDEIVDLGQRGLTYLQLDEVPIALLCDENVRARIEDWGWAWEELLDIYIRSSNAAIEAAPETMTVGMHMCRGNYRGKWIGTGGYEPVAERLFNEVNADVFLLEYDSDRAGDFEPLRFVPSDKSIVLGLVSTKTPVMEDESELKRRIEAASKYVPLDRLAISPQCGFGTTVGGAPMDEEAERRKLELVARVADDMWE
ncbi:MAG: 5-methyltetrahydropteroyltriglutamate--homocysteine S-methyltransferase [Alphaproteobacteria bacterium]|nr:5-methyltetrahydropteroyltriglutamate--homocysteine S-methyltransferase [Alphaproteobacteria bacterium]